MIEADLIRKNGHPIPMGKISKGFILEGYFDYPPILPWLLSFLSKKTLLKTQGFIAPVFDVLQNMFVFVATLQLTSNTQIALLAQVVYATIPLSILENSYLTPRSLGYLTFTAAFYPLILYSLDPNPIYLIIGFLFSIVCFFTHRFSTQSLFFACFFFSIFDRSLFYMTIFLSAMLLAIIFSKGYYLRILKGHIDNINFWVKNYKLRFAHQVRGLEKEKKKRDFVSIIYFILEKFTLLTVLGVNLWLVVPIFFLVDRVFHTGIIPVYIIAEPPFFKMAIWTLFFYIVAVLVLSIKRLQPIGEGQRYLEMTLVPTAILTAVVFSAIFKTAYKDLAIGIFTLILLTNIILTVVAQWFGIIRDTYRSLHKDMERVFTFINRLKPPPRILCIPHQITTMVVYNTKAKVFVDIRAGTLEKLRDVYPVLRKPVQEIAKAYNLNLLILKKQYATLEELHINKRAVILETDDTQVVKL
jgi:hypothetical protein